MNTWKHYTGTVSPEADLSLALLNNGLSPATFATILNSGELVRLTESLMGRISEALPGDLTFTNGPTGWVLTGDDNAPDGQITATITETFANSLI